MKASLFVLTLLAMLLPGVWGCGNSQPSYKDRIGTVDVSSEPEVEIPPPSHENGAKRN